MRAQLLERGRTNTLLARTDNMWATLKVYASGGENGLHMHPHEDHTFVLLQGKARYYDTDGGHTDVGKHEGIMLPAGAYYWFEAVSEEPLVLLRIGCRVGSHDPRDRSISAASRCPGIRKRTSASRSSFATASISSDRRHRLGRLPCDGAVDLWKTRVPREFRDAAPLFPPHKLGEGFQQRPGATTRMRASRRWSSTALRRRCSIRR